MNTLVFESFANKLCQRTVIRFHQVGYFYLGNIGSTSCAHTTHELYVFAFSCKNKVQLRGNTIDTVDNIIEVGRYDFPSALRGEEFVNDGEFQLGVDIQKTCSHHFGFGLPYRRMKGGQLAVDIREGNGISIDNSESSYACTSYKFGSIRAYAP